MWTLFDDPNVGDKLVGWMCLFVAGIYIGLLVA